MHFKRPTSSCWYGYTSGTQGVSHPDDPAEKKADQDADAATEKLHGDDDQRFEALSQEQLFELMWTELKQPGREAELDAATRVLAKKTGAPVDKPQAAEGTPEDYEQRAQEMTDDQLKQQLQVAQSLAAKIPHLKAMAEGYQRALAARAPVGSEAWIEQAAAKMSSQKLQEIIDRVKADGAAGHIHPNEQQMAAQYQKVLEQRAAGKLPEPLQNDPEAIGSLPDPLLAEEDRRVQADGTHQAGFGDMSKDPFYGPSGLPQPGDVFQGALGDCWLLAPLAALAGTRPELIMKAIGKPSGNQVTVNLFKQTPDGKNQPCPVTIDLDFPVSGPNPKDPATAEPADQRSLYAHDEQPGEKSPILWPLIIEKAFASIKEGGYESVGEAGDAMSALATLFGDGVTSRLATADQPDQLWAQLSDAGQQKMPVTALRRHHVFTVLGVDDSAGKMVRVRDQREPGGVTPESEGIDGTVFEPAGVFLVPIAAFAHEFQTEIAQIKS